MKPAASRGHKAQNNVLIGVVKNTRDLNLILKHRIYRMPVSHAPKKKPAYAAFYQPKTSNGFSGDISHWAKIRSSTTLKREKILPRERSHPSAKKEYILLKLGRIRKLPKAIRNKNRIRVSFGFTSKSLLLKSRDIKELLGHPLIEETIAKELNTRRIPFIRERNVTLSNKKRYRLDFAILNGKKPLDIECDGAKWHSQKTQKSKDKLRDQALKKAGWKVLRLREDEVVNNKQACIAKIRKALC
ncbi:endonuclease domain-containing protein [Elusimicrobiota bacterium]